jgi:hypothetical protein
MYSYLNFVVFTGRVRAFNDIRQAILLQTKVLLRQREEAKSSQKIRSGKKTVKGRQKSI